MTARSADNRVNPAAKAANLPSRTRAGSCADGAGRV
jgi:hypothetical protein